MDNSCIVKGTAEMSSASCQHLLSVGENPFLINLPYVKKNLIYTNKKDEIQMDSKEILFKSKNGTM